MKRRAVVTGLGAVTPIGIGISEFWEGIISCRNGVDRIELFDADEFPVKIAGEVRDFEPGRFFDRKKYRHWSRSTQFSVAASLLALEDAEWSERPGDGMLGVVNGVNSSSQDAVEQAIDVARDRGFHRVVPYVLTKCFPHSAASEAAKISGFQDQVMTISTACTAGVNAIGYAVTEIQIGRCDGFVVSGTDSTLSKYAFGCFCRAGILGNCGKPPDVHASRPFDAKRDGGVLGEGAGALVVEELEHARRRGATIYGELLGFGTCGVGYNGNPPEDVPKGMLRAMELALLDANCSSDHVDYVGLHGVSDPHLDLWETRAIKRLFGERAYDIPMSSIKSMIGIPQNAAGVLQLIATAKALQEDILPPTINYEYPDPQCDLDYIPNRPRHNRIDRALVLAHGFNGSDAAVLIGRLVPN